MFKALIDILSALFGKKNTVTEPVVETVDVPKTTQDNVKDTKVTEVKKKMQTSQDGVKLIESFEGFKPDVYLDIAGIWTIGYGHTGPDVVEDTPSITKDQADKLLQKDLSRFENDVNNFVKVSLTQNQFDALVSFTYNLGAGSLKSSTLLKLLNTGNYDAAAQEFLKWNKSNGKPVDGLTRRRTAEQQMFLGNN